MDARTIIVLIGLLLVAAGWFFVSPLFIDKVVDEPLVAGDAMPTRAQVRAMPVAERERLRSQLMAEAAGAPARVVDEGMDMSQPPLLLASGNFSDADAIHRGSGRAAVYKLPAGNHIVRLEDLDVTNGPALVVLLAIAPDPRNAGDVKRGYIKLGKLKGNKGNQNYQLPANIDVTSFGSVVIWCDLFDVLFSPAPLNLH